MMAIISRMRNRIEIRHFVFLIKFSLLLSGLIFLYKGGEVITFEGTFTGKSKAQNVGSGEVIETEYKGMIVYITAEDFEKRQNLVIQSFSAFVCFIVLSGALEILRDILNRQKH